jgi:hypothetical protein
MPFPKTAEEALALPTAYLFDEKYRYIGSTPVQGDSIAIVTDKDGVSWRPDCRRETKDGPDVFVRVRLSL